MVSANAQPEKAAAPAAPRRHWYQRLGPGLITASVVIGPGSILTSSQVGATNGYALGWVVLAAMLFMMVYMTLGARLGVAIRESPGSVVARLAGRWLAVLIGAAVFFMASAFQFGNNMGVHHAFAVYTDFPYTVVVFNALSLAFLFTFRNLYRAVEVLMTTFVALMLVSFALNLALAGPPAGELLLGLVPSGRGTINLALLGLVGTTFISAAAYYQAYLVRQKGWGPAQLREGLTDSRVGSLILGLITLMIMFTAATLLRGEKLEDVTQVAGQIRLFGEAGTAIFCVGLFSAAYSSFLVNSMIGGFLLADGLGLRTDPKALVPRLFTTVVLLLGMGLALYFIDTGARPVHAIVMAQAVTVIAAPLMAGVLLWLTNREDVMGADTNGPVTNVLAGLGLLLLLAMAGRIFAEEVWPKLLKPLFSG